MERTVHGKFVQVAGHMDGMVTVRLHHQGTGESIRVRPHEAEHLAHELIVAAHSAQAYQNSHGLMSDKTPPDYDPMSDEMPSDIGKPRS